MAVLSDLLSRPELGLRPVTVPQDALLKPLRWVATSELDDPTSWLHGGELLLTTGIGLRAMDDEQIVGYVQRIVDAGVVALGYGVGLVTDTVPEQLIAAAARAGLPLIEVDRPTPFIAISKAVSDMLTADQLNQLNRGFKGQQMLVAASIRKGAAGIVAKLAELLGGWAALLGPDDRPRRVSPRSADPAVRSLAAELATSRSEKQIAFSLIKQDEHIIGQRLPSPARLRGSLFAGKTTPFLETDRALVNVAATLLSFDLEGSRTSESAARAGALFRLLLKDEPLDPAVLTGLGGTVVRHDNLYVTAVYGERGVLERTVGRLIDNFGAEILAGTVDDTLYAVTTSRNNQSLVIGIALDNHCRCAGTCTASGGGELGRAARLARRAADAAAHQSRVLAYEDLRSMSPASLIDEDTLEVYAHALLAPVQEYSAAKGIDLVESLRVWLEHHGQIDPAASTLLVHRHTLRYRLEKAAKLLDLDLSSAAARVRLWLAVNAISNSPDH